ncbi:MAG: glycosyltransferase [Bryobacteraceae bacterium]
MILTVFMSAYNAMPYLPLAVDSILRQTWSEFKLLIVDDGSTDDTQEYLRTLTDPRVVSLRQENRGCGATANRGLEMCDTPLMARMDADDIAHPERLAAQMEFLGRNPQTGMLGTQIAYLVEDRKIPAMDFPAGHDAICRALAAKRCPLCHPALIFNTAIARSIGGYRAEGFGEDIDFMLRFTERARVANLTSILHFQRIHNRSGTFRSSRIMARGQSYALYCAGLRRRNLAEPKFAEYLETMVNRMGFASRAAETIEAWATVQYRKSIIDRAMDRPISAYARLGLLALLRPKAVFSRLVSG